MHNEEGTSTIGAVNRIKGGELPYIYGQKLPNGQVRYREISAPGTPGVFIGHAEALKKSTINYLKLNEISVTTLNRLPRNNTPQRGLTDVLQEIRLIGIDDQVYISGWEGNPYYPARFQVVIGKKDNGYCPTENAWFIWNAIGYDPSSGGGSIRSRKNTNRKF